MPPDLLSALAQFGAAGLIGWMWLAERRAAAAREKQLAELHDRLMHERTHVATLLGVLADNTRALTALELGQRRMVLLLERLAAAATRSGTMSPCPGDSKPGA